MTYTVPDAGNVAMNMKDQICDWKYILPTGGRKKTTDT